MIAQISDIVIADKDKEALLEVYRRFCTDNQKFVRQAAIEIIGQFLNTLPENLRLRFILDFYIKTIEEFYRSNDIASQTDNDSLYNCAFNFPAILYLYGKDYWKDLKGIYLKMSTDKYFKVRKSLASSINEVASIIGKEETESVLIPIFDRFYREEGEIQKTIYKSMPKFLLNVQPEKRKLYLDKFKKLLKSREKWRTKREYVEILGNLGGVFDDDLTFEQIFPVCLNMCFDEVSEVRIHAAKSIKSLIKHFLTVERFKEKIKDILKAFAMSLKYIYRLLFIYLAKEMVNDVEIFNEYFFDYVEKLSRDKILNLQILLAGLILSMYEVKSYRENPRFRAIIVRSFTNDNPLVKGQYDSVKDSDYFRSFSSEEIIEIKNLPYSNYEFNNKMEVFKTLNIYSATIMNNAKNKFPNKSYPKEVERYEKPIEDDDVCDIQDETLESDDKPLKGNQIQEDVKLKADVEVKSEGNEDDK